MALGYRDEKTEESNATYIARSFPVTGSLIFTVFGENKWPLNLIAGLGAYFYSLKYDPDVGSDTTETDTHFGYHLGLGTDYELSDGVKLDLKMHYLFLDLSDDGDVVLSDNSANAMMLRAGLTFYY